MTIDAFAHNAQRGPVVKNRLLHPLRLSTLDPADEYLTANDCPARKFDGRRFERTVPPTADFRTGLPAAVEVVPIVEGEYDGTFDLDYGDAWPYFGVSYAVCVNGANVGQYDDALRAYAAAHAVCEFARRHAVDTSRLQ